MRAHIAWIWALLALGAAPAGAGSVALHGENSLSAAVERNGYCCVVDARAPAQRAKDALADAVLYSKGVVIKPGAAVVVIADTDAEALAVGVEIQKRSGAAEVIAVKGGVQTWRAYLERAAGAPPSGYSFIIPRNTCESGQAIQELSSERK